MSYCINCKKTHVLGGHVIMQLLISHVIKECDRQTIARHRCQLPEAFEKTPNPGWAQPSVS